jgi:hypothetical protein
MVFLVGALRVLIGLGALVLLIITYMDTSDTIRYAGMMDASAGQVTQVYAEGIFKALAITGGALALYIMSRCYQHSSLFDKFSGPRPRAPRNRPGWE